MLFNSLGYAVFLPIVFIVYWLIPHKYRWIFLLGASYYFYMSWNPKYVILILGTTLLSYLCAIKIEKTDSKKTKKVWMMSALVVLIGLLFVFKYLNFFSASVCEFLGLFSIKLNPFVYKLVLPVGISFYSFQMLSYVIDVYKGTVPAEHNFAIYASFISYFPKLFAGPIERASNLIPQIKSDHKIDPDQIAYGLKLMLWGYFKKMVVSDYISKYVDAVYGNVNGYHGFSFFIASVLFSIQIYCDFSGYSDIAIGTSELFGIHLMTNFRSPYFSKSVKEFWNRWHISLSTWFRDYVYIPLGGNRCSKAKHRMNLFVTLLLSGLWHGANWTFLAWGGVHGLALVAEDVLKKPLAKIHNSKIGGVISWIVTCFFCNLAWVFFRADSISQACFVIRNMFSGIGNIGSYVASGIAEMAIPVGYIGVLLIILFIYDLIGMNTDAIKKLNKKSPWIKWPIYIIMTLIVVFMSQKGEPAEFIYLQF